MRSCFLRWHLQNVMQISEMLMNDQVVEALTKAETPEDLLKIQEEFLD